MEVVQLGNSAMRYERVKGSQRARTLTLYILLCGPHSAACTLAVPLCMLTIVVGWR